MHHGQTFLKICDANEDPHKEDKPRTGSYKEVQWLRADNEYL